MTIHRYVGGCHCGNISIELAHSGEPNTYNPRACDCDFCLKYTASYITDPLGKLAIVIKDEANLNKYRHSSGIANFLVCNICGVLVGVFHEENEQLFAAVNSKVFSNNTEFGAELAVSPKTLSDQERIQRWKNIWFTQVSIKMLGT